jgi:hypothetical protein
LIDKEVHLYMTWLNELFLKLYISMNGITLKTVKDALN